MNRSQLATMQWDDALVKQLDRKHVFHSWSAQKQIDPLVVAGAEGSYVWNHEGERWLDFSSQLVNTNIGHQHPRVVAAIKEQADRLCTIAPQHAYGPRAEAAQRIAGLAPEGLDRVFFTNGGADAIEHAVRMARLHTGRTKVMSAYRSYHGGTATAINLTGDPRRWPNDNGSSGVVHFFGPFLYRSHFHATTEQEECERALAHLTELVEFEGPGNIAAIVLESIPGTAGIIVPPAGYLSGVRDLCDRHGIVMVLDEVMTGFGRTGAWFARDHWNVTPDLIAFAKGVNSGYVPLGGVLISDDIAATFDDRPFPGGLTYSGHPLACAAALATLDAMDEEGMVDHAAMMGEQVFGPALRELEEQHPSVGEVRGLGVFWALELVRDPATREPLAPYGGSSDAMAETVSTLKRGGVLPFVNFNRIHVVPPCNISEEDARRGLDVLDAALSVADRHVWHQTENQHPTVG